MPLRWIFRSRWAALLWATGICLTAVRLVGTEGQSGPNGVDAARAADGLRAAGSALSAEDAE